MNKKPWLTILLLVVFVISIASTQAVTRKEYEITLMRSIYENIKKPVADSTPAVTPEETKVMLQYYVYNKEEFAYTGGFTDEQAGTIFTRTRSIYRIRDSDIRPEPKCEQGYVCENDVQKYRYGNCNYEPKLEMACDYGCNEDGRCKIRDSGPVQCSQKYGAEYFCYTGSPNDIPCAVSEIQDRKPEPQGCSNIGGRPYTAAAACVKCPAGVSRMIDCAKFDQPYDCMTSDQMANACANEQMKIIKAPYGCMEYGDPIVKENGYCVLCVGPDPSTGCRDEDNGMDYYRKGKVFGKPSTQYSDDVATDYCTDEKILREFYVDKTSCQIGYKNFDCQFGCKDGACVRDSAGSVNCQENDQGLDYSNAARVIGEPSTMYGDDVADDYCIDTKRLKEFYLQYEHPGHCYINYKEYECPNMCINGACARQNNTNSTTYGCNETDGGDNPYVMGRVHGVPTESSNWDTPATDYCVVPGQQLKEYYLNIDNCHIEAKMHDCNCGNGACIEQGISVSAPANGCGDVDGDHLINRGDIVFLTNYMFNGGIPPVDLERANVNGDTYNDIGDIVWLVSYVFHDGPEPYCIWLAGENYPAPADDCGNLNGDSRVDYKDLIFFINYAFKGGPAPGKLVWGDVNSDKSLDISDITYLVNYIYHQGPKPKCPPPIENTNVKGYA